jgi:ER-derived vesicles protein
MASRINIARPGGTSAYNNAYSPDTSGYPSARPTGGFRAANSDNLQDRLRAFASQVEDSVEIHSQPLKPHLPAIGRFLIVVTFLEDSWRIMTQWSDQLWYLQRSVIRFAWF